MDKIAEAKKWLRQYKDLKIEILNLQDQLHNVEDVGNSIDLEREPTSRTYKFNSETENIALKAVTIKSRIDQIQRMINIIERSLEALNTEERKIIELRYCKDKSWNYISIEVRYSVPWCHEMHSKAIEKLASMMFGRD